MQLWLCKCASRRKLEGKGFNRLIGIAATYGGFPKASPFPLEYSACYMETTCGDIQAYGCFHSGEKLESFDEINNKL